MHRLKIKQRYEPHSRGDRQPVLVDRVRPRGLSKEKPRDVIR
jgi:uncharacterized protein YeaO (DUF488 family)